MAENVSLKMKVVLRNDLAAKWTEADAANNLVLLKGEVGIETDTGKFKIGDGAKNWKALSYSNVLPAELAAYLKVTDLLDGNVTSGKIKSKFLPEIASSNINVFTKETLATADEAFVKQEIGKLIGTTTFGKGDIFVVVSKDGAEGPIHSINSYVVKSKPTENTAEQVWAACQSLNGNVDASKVIMGSDITLAGEYTSVGNIKLSEKKIAAKGKSVADVLTSVFTKKLQPTKTNPSVTGFVLTGAGNKEVGTKLESVSFSGATFQPGSYTYGPATGVTAKTWKVDRVVDVPSGGTDIDAASVATAPTGTDDNSGNGFILGDFKGENVVSSLKYTITASYDKSNAVALDNLGGASSPEIRIEAGTTPAVTTAAYTCHRKYFYGAKADLTESLSSEVIRGYTPSSGAYAPTKFTINIQGQGDAHPYTIVIACEASKKGLVKVINKTALNSDVTGKFNEGKKVMEVAGANGYHPVQYNVWIWKAAFNNNAELEVTLG